MTASGKITEAENILKDIQYTQNDKFNEKIEDFVKTINDVFVHLLDEYNVKFGLKIQRIGLEKFKSIAKKTGKIEAINFLIWYEKEYRNLRNDPVFGQILEKGHVIHGDNLNRVKSCSQLLDATKKMTYYAYENF